MRKWLPLLAVCLGTFMLLIDVTIVNVALPDMAVSLKTSFASLQWVLDAYALTLAAFVLGAGSVADVVGQRRVYAAGLAVFAAASAACGSAPNATTLDVCRAVQGVGGAAMFATSIALLHSSYAGRDRGTAFGLWGATAGASAGIGPVLGGLLTEGLSWHWIFFVNLPVSVIAIALCLFALTDSGSVIRHRIDVAGIVTFSAAAAAATYAMIRAAEHGWSTPGTWGLLVASALLLAVFYAIESAVAAPMLDLTLLRNRAFTGVLVGGLLLNFSAFAYLAYTSVWLQSVLGLSPVQAGLIVLPLSGLAFVVAAVAGRFLHENRPDLVIGGGLLLIGAGGLLTALFLHGAASWAALVPGFAVCGVGVGLATPTTGSAALAVVPPSRGGMAGGALNTARQLGFAFGIAVLGTVFASLAGRNLTHRGVPYESRLARALSGGQAQDVLRAASPSSRGSLDHLLHAAAIDGLRGAFLVAGIAGIAAAIVVCVMARPRRPAAAEAPPASLTSAERHETTAPRSA
jgi:EmrB/QacA subfamily drug resistance transporter